MGKGNTLRQDGIRSHPCKNFIHIRLLNDIHTLTAQLVYLLSHLFRNNHARWNHQHLIVEGLRQVKAGQVPQALKYYDRAIAVNPAYGNTYARKADALAGLGREADALKAIEKAIEVTSIKPERFWVQKGALLERFKRPADARAAYAKARTLNPKLLVAWRKELELAQAAGDTAAADAARAKCLELDPMGKK